MKKTVMLLAPLVALLAGAARLQAQADAGASSPPKIPGDPLIYFYNPRLDTLGQNLEKAAGGVAAGQIFDSQLSNLDAMAKLAADRIFSSARRAALARLEAARDWGTLYLFVDLARKKALPSRRETEAWQKQIEQLKTQAGAAKTTADSASDRLKGAADLLEEVGKAQEVIQFANFLQERKPDAITKTDLRLVGQVQESLANIGGILDDFVSHPKPASTRSAAEQVKVDLAKAEIDHLKALIKIEEKRLAGEDDLRHIFTAIDHSSACDAAGQCTARFEDSQGNAESVPAAEGIEATLSRYRQEAATDPARLKTAVYLLENFAALCARAETPVRLAQLRSAIEERRFAIRRDAILARGYERIFLIGAQRIALYYQGGVKPEAIAQFLQAAATAGLIPTIALK